MGRYLFGRPLPLAGRAGGCVKQNRVTLSTVILGSVSVKPESGCVEWGVGSGAARRNENETENENENDGDGRLVARVRIGPEEELDVFH